MAEQDVEPTDTDSELGDDGEVQDFWQTDPDLIESLYAAGLGAPDGDPELIEHD